jgi:hypothetical protein
MAIENRFGGEYGLIRDFLGRWRGFRGRDADGFFREWFVVEISGL